MSFLGKLIRLTSEDHSSSSTHTVSPSPEKVGELGEQIITDDFVRLILSGHEGRIVRNVYIPKANGESTEIDLLFVTKKGVFVIESKNYGGWIFGDENSVHWTATFKGGRKYQFYNPILQNRTHIKWLLEYLKSPIRFSSIIVFSDRAEFKKLSYNFNSCRVINQRELMNTINVMWGLNPDCLNDQQVNVIFNALRQLATNDPMKKLNHIAEVNKAKELLNSGTRCPLCGKELVLRTARTGANAGKQFYGCKGYPNCRYTRKLED